MPRRKGQTDFTLSKKLELIDKIKIARNENSGVTTNEIANHLKISPSFLRKLVRDEKTLKLKSTEHIGNTSFKRYKYGKNPEIEKALLHWFSTMNARAVRMSGPILCEKAREFGVKLGYPDFKPTDGWLTRWKKRNDIVYKRAHGERSSADQESAKVWQNAKLEDILARYDPDDIYNADETGLFYRATPDGSLTYRHETISGWKKAMDRVTVLCCTNMTGTDKKKLVVIGKARKPKCFGSVSVEKLPVTYYANTNAWMTSSIFTEWLQN